MDVTRILLMSLSRVVWVGHRGHRWVPWPVLGLDGILVSPRTYRIVSVQFVKAMENPCNVPLDCTISPAIPKVYLPNWLLTGRRLEFCQRTKGLNTLIRNHRALPIFQGCTKLDNSIGGKEGVSDDGY